MKAFIALPRRSSGRLHDRVTGISVPIPRIGSRLMVGNGTLDRTCAAAGALQADIALAAKIRKPMVTGLARIFPPYFCCIGARPRSQIRYTASTVRE
jgi:hypothetical protein